MIRDINFPMPAEVENVNELKESELPDKEYEPQPNIFLTIAVVLLAFILVPAALAILGVFFIALLIQMQVWLGQLGLFLFNGLCIMLMSVAFYFIIRGRP